MTMTNGERASRRTSTAATVFGSCMSERIPSCMRAPPEAVTATSGTPRSAARSAARENFSPTALPIEPPMNAKSMTASSQGRRSIAAAPATSASPSPVAISAWAIRSVYAFRSKNESGSAERRSASSSTNVPRSASWEIRSRARHGEVVVALGADPQVRLELVVAVVRPALRAGVRVLLPAVVRRLAPVLDHHLVPAPPSALSYARCAAGPQRPSGGDAKRAR